MNFTTPCFIRKNSQELRLKLIELGYYNYTQGDNDDGSWLYTTERGIHVARDKLRVDCGENEGLFLAIATLREDSDINQWFISERGDWQLSKSSVFKTNHSKDLKWHKASVEELIEKFK